MEFHYVAQALCQILITLSSLCQYPQNSHPILCISWNLLDLLIIISWLNEQMLYAGKGIERARVEVSWRSLRKGCWFFLCLVFLYSYWQRRYYSDVCERCKGVSLGPAVLEEDRDNRQACFPGNPVIHLACPWHSLAQVFFFYKHISFWIVLFAPDWYNFRSMAVFPYKPLLVEFILVVCRCLKCPE